MRGRVDVVYVSLLLSSSGGIYSNNIEITGNREHTVDVPVCVAAEAPLLWRSNAARRSGTNRLPSTARA